MGRGRAKAKQQKVARDLKYSTHSTDLDALARELGAGGGRLPERVIPDEDEDEDEWSAGAR